MNRRTFEVFREGEYGGTFDVYEEAHREALCSRRPWQIFACEGYSARCIAHGDGTWRATHDLSIPVTRAALHDADVCIGWSLTALMATPEGLLFTQGAWDRGDPPDFRNTAGGLKRGDGRPLPSSVLLTVRGA